MKIFYLFLALAGGAFMPIQAGVNAKLKGVLGDPILAALVSFAVGTVGLAVFSLILRLPWPAGAFSQGPFWIWLGGLLGAFFVAATIFLAIKIGAASMIAWLIAGQLLMALLLDHYGLIGYAQRSITPERIMGAVLLVAGAVLIRR